MSLALITNGCNLEAFWDSEAQVWVATSKDVPGPATEARTIKALAEKLRMMIPELILLNHLLPNNTPNSISFQLTSRWEELIEVAS